MKIVRAKDYQELSRKAANVIFAQVVYKPDSVLGLATGSSPIGTYQELVERHRQGDLDFSEVVSVNLDEYRGLPASDPQSYDHFMREHLFGLVNIKPENTYLPNGVAADPNAECARYDALIESLGGVDLQLLGCGRNGHIGFNEPADCFSKGTQLVDLTESTIEANKRFFASADEVPRQAFSMGIRTILHARRILTVISGEDKAQAVRDGLFGPITPQVPLSALQLHPNAIVIVDDAAFHLCVQR